MTQQEILLARGEYQNVDEGVTTLVSTIVKKLPAPQRKKYEPIVWQQRSQTKEAELIQAGILAEYLSAFLGLNAAQTQRGRSYRKICSILSDMQRLHLTYEALAINQALSKIAGYADPHKANIAYLKAVLKNTSPPPHFPPSVEGAGGGDDTQRQPDRPLWEQVKALLQERLARGTYTTWFRNTRHIRCSDDVLHVSVPDELTVFKLPEFAPHYDAALATLGFSGDVEFEIDN